MKFNPKTTRCPKCGGDDFYIRYKDDIDKLEIKCFTCDHRFYGEPITKGKKNA